MSDTFGSDYDEMDLDSEELGEYEINSDLMSQEDDDLEDFEEMYMDDGFLEDQPYFKKKEFEVVNTEDLINNQQKKVYDIAEALGLAVSTAGALLRHFKWNEEKLYEQFFDHKDKICKESGIVFSDHPYLKGDPKETVTCPVCYEDVRGDEMLSLSCKHYMCINCWKKYLEYAIDDGYSCLKTTCPNPTCKLLVDESLFNHCVSNVHKKYYLRYLTRSFVDDNNKIRWCPAPDCGKAVYCPDSSNDVVKCACGTKFCFKCQRHAHAPASCDDLTNWKKKERDESETANWLVANTKPCPNCNKQIEKNGGCNHMTCSQCKYEFCWVCMDDWKKHDNSTGGFYKCNRYKPSEVEKKNQKSSRDEARRAIEKYMHYFKRYANHANSEKFEKVILQKAEAKMKDIQAKNKYKSWVDVEYIKNGSKQLIECRNTLKYTYIYGYYLPEGKEKNMFEFQQEDLERVTEKLSEILEGPIDKIDRAEIINTTKNASTRLNNLLRGCKEGLVG